MVWDNEITQGEIIKEMEKIPNSSIELYISFIDSDALISVRRWGGDVWDVEVMLTVTDFTEKVATFETVDTPDEMANNAYATFCDLAAKMQILEGLGFEKVDVFLGHTVPPVIDFVYKKHYVEDKREVARNILKVVNELGELVERRGTSELSTFIDRSLGERAKKLEGWERKVFNAYYEAFIFDRKMGTPQEEAGWRTRSKIANELSAHRQIIYRHGLVFASLCKKELLVERPYSGPGGRGKSCCEYKVNSEAYKSVEQTVQQILK